jgi:multimeric flavodoxin WrbA
MKSLLIVYHSQSGKTEAMARAAARGASHPDLQGVSVRTLPALQAGPADLLRCDGLVLGTPENFGYMSGGMKDFLDRTFYACEGRVQGLPVAVFVAAGNDGTGALAALRRIFNGYGFREVREPVIAVGPLRQADLAACEELGMALAAGLELGMF